MNKLTIYTSIGIIFALGILQNVSAYDQNIFAIPTCWNAIVILDQAMGSYTPINVVGCTKLEGGLSWYCDCHDSGAVYNITIHNDNETPADNPRIYKSNITYSACNISTFENDGMLKVWGKNTYLTGETTAQNIPVRELDIIHTVYRDNTSIKYVYVNNTVHDTVYIENTTKIDVYNAQVNNLTNINTMQATKIHKDGTTKIWLTIIIIVLIIYEIWAWIPAKKKSKKK